MNFHSPSLHSRSISRLFRRAAAVAALALVSAIPATASLKIVLTNDDGFEAPNIQALFTALKAAGHDVILSAPYVNQSGTSGMVAFMTPLTPTTKASQHGALSAGSPGAGPTGLIADQYYVNSTPVAAVLYGIDVLAPAKWGTAPDLVISGPNEGNNLGLVTPHSGTVGAAITALNKGIPAIAVSASTSDATDAPLVAALTLKLVSAIEHDGHVVLPTGIGLNVNTPAFDLTATPNKTVADFDFALTRIGKAADFGLKFFAKLSDSSVAEAYLPAAYLAYPGVSIEMPYTAAGYAADNDPRSETNKIEADANAVTVSPIQGTYEAREAELCNRLRLGRLFEHGSSSQEKKH